MAELKIEREDTQNYFVQGSDVIHARYKGSSNFEEVHIDFRDNTGIVVAEDNGKLKVHYSYNPISNDPKALEDLKKRMSDKNQRRVLMTMLSPQVKSVLERVLED